MPPKQQDLLLVAAMSFILMNWNVIPLIFGDQSDSVLFASQVLHAGLLYYTGIYVELACIERVDVKINKCYFEISNFSFVLFILFLFFLT